MLLLFMVMQPVAKQILCPEDGLEDDYSEAPVRLKHTVGWGLPFAII